MIKKTLILGAVIALIISFSACAVPFSKVEKASETETGQSYESEESLITSRTETQTQTQPGEETGTVPDSTAVMPDMTSVTEKTTFGGYPSGLIEPVSTEVQTIVITKPVKSTTRAATKAPTTTRRPTTTARPATTAKYEGETRVQSVNVNENLKYGVRKTGTRNDIYAVNADGTVTKIAVGSEDVTYNRVGYSAGYGDLLPAAKDNAAAYGDLIKEVLRLTNKMRTDKGLAPLTLNDRLVEQASVRAEEIAWSGLHSHRRPGNKYYTSIFRENGFNSGTAGENIGWGYDKPIDVCNAWRNSETHYENIINGDFKSIGIGIAPDCDPERKLCWVQHFYSE
jgi:uncharacterized protein YkwD